MARPKGVALKLTKEELERLYFVENKSTVDIGALYGCDRKNIDYYFKKFGIMKKSLQEAQTTAFANKRGTTIDPAYVLSQVESGRLVQDIAKELKVSRRTLGEHCQRAGLSFANNVAQRGMQSIFMSAKNPVPKGTTRDPSIQRKVSLTKSQLFHYRMSAIEDMTFKQYARVARYISYKYFKNNGLYNDHLKEIDHMLSLRDGYANKIPVTLISHPMNIRLITGAENRSKGGNSVITLEEFYRRVGLE